MEMSQNISISIISQLKKELPTDLQDKILEFEALVDSGNYRAAYSVLDELKRTKGWSPSQTLLGYYERFWWEFAN
jgi:hypothetical protein